MPDAHLPGSGGDPEFLLDRIASKILEKICCWAQPVKAEYAKRGKLLVVAYYPDGHQPPGSSQLPFRMFSDREQRVVDFFLSRGNERASRTAVAKVLWDNDRPDPSDLATFTNLLDRKVLEEPQEGRGIRLSLSFLAFAESLKTSQTAVSGD